MENEQVKQPTYEELVQAYNNMVRMVEEARAELQAVKSDKILERLTTMMRILENKDVYPDKISKLAVWHAEQIMAKPKA
jgi:hypothetical protein